MKKQILVLVVFVLAAFAGINKSYGQGCVEDALHPLAGKEYEYKMTGAGGTEKSILWFVTTNPAIVNGGALAGALPENATTYTLTDEDKATAKITWAPELIADALLPTGNKYYVVVRYVATNAAGCDVENIKAFKIKPVNMFQITLANVDNNGTAKADGNVCTSAIAEADITDDGTTATIVYDYGVTNIYVKVTAKNFSESWAMSVNRSALIAAAAGTGETAKLYYGATAAGAATEILNDDPVTISETSTDPTNEEVIYLRLEVSHGIFDGTTPETFAFVVNGEDTGGNPDVSDTCAEEEDTVSQTILARPTIANNGTTGGDFIAAP